MRYLLLLLLFLPLLTACGDEPSKDELVGTQWIFATQNPVGEEQAPMTIVKNGNLLRPGAIITLTDTSIEVSNPDFFMDLTLLRYDSLRGGDTMRVSARWNQPDPSILNVDVLERGVVTYNRYFTRLDTSLTLVDGKSLAGGTYRYQQAGLPSENIYFDYSRNVEDGLEPVPYFVEFPNDWMSDRSMIQKSRQMGNLFGPFNAVDLEGPFVRMGYKDLLGNFGKGAKRLYRNSEGSYQVEVFDVHEGKHRLQYVYLEPVEGTVPTGITRAELGKRLTEAAYVVDKDYPVIDSVDVQYTQPERLPGRVLAYADLDRLEFSFNEDGSFFFVVGDALFRSGTWRLSDDRNWLIVENDKSTRPLHLPILAYSDEKMAFRLPLDVLTREPRGVKLPSYASINAYVEARFR